MTQEISSIYTEIVRRLAAFRKKENVADAAHGALLSSFSLLAIFLLLLLLEQLFFFGVFLRAIVFWLFIFAACALFLRYVVRPLLRLFNVIPGESDETTASKVGKAFPHIKDRLANVLLLYREREYSEYYSVELIDASFEDVRNDVDRLDFTSAISYAGSRRMGKFLALAVSLGALFLLIFPASFFGSAGRLFNYSQTFAAPAPFRFIVEPGDREVVKGENVEITVRVEGEQQNQIILRSRPEGQVTDEERTLNLNRDGMFRFEFSSLKSTTKYSVCSGNVESPEYVLRVSDRPMVRMLRLTLVFPSYSKLEPRTLDDNIGDVTALKGTTIKFLLESNKELSLAQVVFSDSSDAHLDVTGNRATGSIVLMKERTYHLLLKDRQETPNSDPITYTVRIVPDMYPTASILVPGMNLDIAENVTLNLLFKITDDYGFSNLRLAYKLVQSRYEKPAEDFTFLNVPLPGGIETEGMVPFAWPLARLNLVPEDIVSYYVEVFDNDNVSGPKSSISEIYSLRLPSLDEVFTDVDKAHDTSLTAMKEAFEQSEVARKELEELRQDLKKNQQRPDWEARKKAEDLVKKYGEIQKKLTEVNKTLEQVMEKLEKNQVLSNETLEKYQELQQLMEQMNSPEFADAMKRLEAAMEQLNPEAMKQALQQFSFSEETFRKSIERTMNLLKRIQIEQKMDEMVKRAEQMMKEQEELQGKTEKAGSPDKEQLEELIKQQRELQAQLSKLKRELAELQKKMEEFPGEMPLSSMEKVNTTLEQTGLESQMGEITGQLEQQSMTQAASGQKQALQKLDQLMRQLQQTKDAMQQQQQRQIVNEMRRTLQDLLELSQRQEELKNGSQRLEQNSQRYRGNAEGQMDVMHDLGTVTERLSGLSQKTFGVTPEMGRSIGSALRSMSDAMQSLDQRNGVTAGQQQSAAMGSLNEAAELVQGAMNAMMQGGEQGMGMAGLLQRLQQMTGMQQRINDATQNMDGMSPQRAAEMARLAGEQGMVRKSLEQLAKEASSAGQLSRLLGDLNSVAKEMREVQTDLAQGNVNPETLRKQDRILSRLLDSQRSMHERDFEKKRKSESGTAIARKGPGELDVSTREGKDRLQRDLLKALDEGYAPDYQDLIKKYFEALEQYEKKP